MPIESLSDYRDRSIRYLNSTYKSVDGRAGWGLNKQKGISITNTCEAILSYQELDGLQENINQDRKEQIVNYLSKELRKLIDSENVRIRDLAGSNLALSILGDTSFKESAIQRLISISCPSGGWPEFSNENQPCLVQTYYALICLQRLGEKIDSKHISWLSLLQKENRACSFRQDDLETSFGSSSLVLYLATILGNSEQDWVRSLANKTRDELKQTFSKIQSNDNSWLSYDRHSTFTILGYGHALSALNNMRYDLYDSSLLDFLSSIENVISMENIPATREAAIAMRAIRLNYDPFHYFKSTKKEIEADIENRMEVQRQNLVQSSERLRLYQTLIDEWEKDIIKQRHDLPRLMISEYLKYLQGRKKRFWRAFTYYCTLTIVFTGAIIAIIEKILANSFTFESSYLIVLAITPVLIELLRWYKSIKVNQNQ